MQPNKDSHHEHQSNDHDEKMQSSTHMNHDQMQEHKHHMHMDMNHEGHEDHGGMNHSMKGMGNLKTKFIVSCFLTIPILFLAPMMGINLPFQFSFKGSEYLVLCLSTILFFYGGMPFLKGALMELKMKQPAMMTLISLGISVAYFYSVYAFIMNNFIKSSVHVMDFFWELATLILIMLLGHWIEMNTVANAGSALKKLAALLPDTAFLLDSEDNVSEVSLDKIKINDHLLIKAGGKIPADGTVLSGSSSVNESMITGEVKGVSKTIESKVIGGSLNGLGVLTIKVTATSKEGYLAQVTSLVMNAQKEKSRLESMSDLVSRWLFYIALFVGLSAFIVWFLITKNITTALRMMVGVLVIACPHALGLAIPLVIARSTAIGAKNGLLIKNRKALEAARNIKVVMMDKTGTLTEGNFEVTKVISYDQTYSEEKIISYFGALEAQSSHPLAVGITKLLEKRKIIKEVARNVVSISGVGLEGTVQDKEYKIVNEAYLSKNKIAYDTNDFNELSSSGNSISYLIQDEKVIGLVAQGDVIKVNAKQAIGDLKKRGIISVMLTGDNQQTADMIAKQLGMDHVYAQLLPENKAKIIKEYQEKDYRVMMVGDGINDAPSLASADIGVAIGAGSDIAIDSADAILVKSDPQDIIHLLELAKATSKKMTQNLWWGAGYNIIAIPLAAGVLAGAGIILSPPVGALIMSCSTVVVAINAMTLKIK